MKSQVGNLTIASRIGDLVLCIRQPDISFWTEYNTAQEFPFIPQVGEKFCIYSHIKQTHGFPSPYLSGVLLGYRHAETGRLVRLKNEEVYAYNIPLGEPFFAYDCFVAISRP